VVKSSIHFPAALLFTATRIGNDNDNCAGHKPLIFYVVKTNLMQYLSLIYFVKQPLHVSGVFTVYVQQLIRAMQRIVQHTKLVFITKIIKMQGQRNI
jgi:hypothetical protein